VAAATVLTWLNGFRGVFVYDDLREIVENASLRGWPGLLRDRPLVLWSLWLNFRLGGLEVAGWHAFNLAVHVLAGLALFGVVRRVLLLDRFQGRFEHSAHRCAAAVALLWSLHPLQTESVTYIIQRAESMMGLFYLLTLYCLLRAAGAPRPRRWWGAGVAACAAGMLCKPVMVTAPVAVLLLDGLLVSGSFREALRRRGAFYAGLAATWLLTAATIAASSLLDADPDRPVTAGLGYRGASPVAYLLTQPGVILHYLRLALWPHPLCLDYAWPIARTAEEIVLPALVLVLAAAGAVAGARRHPASAFLALGFLLVLAPTSSVMPSAHPAVEHRMYLPLAAVVAALVFGVARLLQAARLRLPAAARGPIAAGLVLAVSASLALATVDRNRDYHSAGDMWRLVAAQRPENPLPYNQLGNLTAEAGDDEGAAALYRRGLGLSPDDALLHTNLANVLLRLGRLEESVRHGRRAVQLRPDLHRAHDNLGSALVALGEVEEGIGCLRAAAALKPGDPWVRASLGRALAIAALGGDAAAPRPELGAEAAAQLVEAIRLQPGFEHATRCLIEFLSRQADIDAAAAPHCRVDGVPAAWSMAYALRGERAQRAGRPEEAAADFRRAIAIDPFNGPARARLQPAGAAVPR
jgi:tetratricopeptide (TPR) repeat protein